MSHDTHVNIRSSSLCSLGRSGVESSTSANRYLTSMTDCLSDLILAWTNHFLFLYIFEFIFQVRFDMPKRALSQTFSDNFVLKKGTKELNL